MEPIHYTEEANKLLEELENESDRALAIVGAVYLEVKLRQVLKRRYPDDDKYDDDPGPGKNLSFCVWIDDAESKGLLSESNRKALTSIRRVRNHFAHKIFCSFDDAEVQEMCRSLDFKFAEFNPGREDDIRYRFARHVHYLFALLWMDLESDGTSKSLSA